ncbi:hypothetical protein Q5752_005055 [Cryptotrichosporon argae]
MMPLDWGILFSAATTAVICVALAVAFVSLVLSARTSGPVKLETLPDGRAETRKDVLARALLDNLDHSVAAEGEIVGLAAFWTRARVLKAVALVPVAASVAIQAWSSVDAVRAHAPTVVLLHEAAELVMSLTILLIMATNAVTASLSTHKSLTICAALLSGVSVSTRFLSTFGPLLYYAPLSAPPRAFAQMAAVVLQTCILVNVRLAPGVHDDLVNLYSSAARKALLASPATETAAADESNTNALYHASILSRTLLAFTIPLVHKIAAHDQIDVTDLPAICRDLRAQVYIPHVVDPSKPVIEGRNPTTGLLKRLVRAERGQFLLMAAIIMLETPLWYVPHFCRQQILKSLDAGLEWRATAAAYSVVHVVGTFGIILLRRQSKSLAVRQMQPRVRLHVRYLLFQKLLTRNTLATPDDDDDNTQAGNKGIKSKVVHSKADLLNLISVDALRLATMPFDLVDLAFNQLQMLCGCTYVWFLLGWSGAAGLATVALIYPLAYLLSRWQYRLSDKQLALSDKKLGLMQEAIQAISMIKMMAAEWFWYRRISDVRNEQFRYDIYARALGTCAALLYGLAPIMVVLVAFAHYTLVAGHTLTPSVAFTSLAVFAEVQPALISLPREFASLLQQVLAARRIGAFLLSTDIEPLSASASTPLDPSADLRMRGTIAWDVTAERTPKGFALQDVDVTFPRGQLTLIAGKFGSGKSLLLLGLLGEARLIDGEVSYAFSHVLKADELDSWDLIPDGVAYCPQMSWLQSLSICENIQFGLPLNVERYQAVLHACGLLPDLHILEDGDLTEIGERGKILSGGQKARVSLARAVYSRASTLVLDDVISAIDAQTSKHILDHCFKSPLMAGRTIIIASHAVEALAPIAPTTPSTSTTGGSYGEPRQEMEIQPAEASSLEMVPYDIKAQTPKTPRQLVVEEEKVKGNVDIRLWFALKKLTGNNLFWAITSVLMVITALLPVVYQKVLEQWTTKVDIPQRELVFWLGLYAGLRVAAVVLDSIFSLWRFLGAIRATKLTHSRMLEHVLRSKMVFFTKTRAGSIIQRFGLLIYVITVCVSGGWQFAIIIVLATAAVWRPCRSHRMAVRQCRRLEAVIPGAVNAIYGEVLAGTAVVRAAGAQSIFLNELCGHFNVRTNTQVWQSYLVSMLYINMRVIDTVLRTTVLILLLANPRTTGASAGFTLTFASSISLGLHAFLWNLLALEQQGVSLERTQEYCSLPMEDGEPLNPDDPQDTDAAGHVIDTPAQWPSAGAIEARDLRVRYAPDLPDILHGVSFSIQGGQRVGIVGATGSGKSTLAKAFFSFVDVTGGHIDIDGIDTASVPLGTLRSRLGIIAQDPVLLSGSLRLNLDLEGVFKDEQLFEALHHVQLLKAPRNDGDAGSDASSDTAVDTGNAGGSGNINVFANLDYEIKSGGENLSAGQRQLIVLARALLKRHKVLILDEATASIDSATDAEISRVVHQEFVGTTVLIIAHRLRTIMPCSKILVMDNGTLIQQGAPTELIKMPGKFQDLCKAAGPEEFDHLLSLAQHAS